MERADTPSYSALPPRAIVPCPLTHKYGVFQPTALGYPQHVVDKELVAVDKWNRCNKDLTRRNHMFTIYHNQALEWKSVEAALQLG